MEMADGFSQQAPHPVTNNCASELSGRHKSVPIISQSVRNKAQHQHRMPKDTPFSTHTLKVFAPLKPVPPLHPLSSVPIHLLNMVGGNSKDVTATRAARLQYSTTTLRLHTLTESMNALATANFGLPCTLG
jgi:hypothetical protein